VNIITERNRAEAATQKAEAGNNWCFMTRNSLVPSGWKKIQWKLRSTTKAMHRKPQQSSIFSPFTISFRFVIDYEALKSPMRLSKKLWKHFEFTRHSGRRIKAALVTVARSCCFWFRFSSPLPLQSHGEFSRHVVNLSRLFLLHSRLFHHFMKLRRFHMHEEFQALKQIGDCIHRMFRKTKAGENNAELNLHGGWRKVVQVWKIKRLGTGLRVLS
jgi:hypothetical protein